MCGDIPANCYKVEVSVYLPIGTTSINVPLVSQLQNVKEVWLNEYLIANGDGPFMSSLWRLGLGMDFPDFVTTNATANGYPIFVKTGTTHVVYDNPRVMFKGNKQLVNNIIFTLTQNTNTASSTDISAEAMFKITFVCQDLQWQPDRTVAEGVIAPQRAGFPFATKATFM